MRLFFIFASAICFASLSVAKCFKITGRVVASSAEYVDVAYREKNLRLYYIKAERKNLLPKGVSLHAYFEKSKESKYITDYSAIDIPRRNVASSSEGFVAAKLTKDGKCLRDFK